MAAKNRGIYPKCRICKKRPKVDGSRGICGTCYRAAHRAVTAGQTTWEALENEGLVDPPRRRMSEFVQAMTKAGK